MAYRRVLGTMVGLTVTGSLLAAVVAATAWPPAAPTDPDLHAPTAAVAASGPVPTSSPLTTRAAPGTSTVSETPKTATPTSTVDVPTRRWQAVAAEQDKTTAAARIVAAAQHAPVRVVTVQDQAGRPVITTTTVTGQAAASLARHAAADPTVLALDVDTRASALGVSNDPYRSTQWALDALGAETVNDRHDANGVTVAVIDSGVQADHPDLSGVVLSGIDYVSTGGNGSADGNGHGTHVAGIVAAIAGNGVGVAGFAHHARILPVRVLDSTGSGWSSDIAKGIVYAADHGARIANLSLGAPATSSTMESAISYAVGRGTLVVAAAGNERQRGNSPSYPAASANALAVAATDSSGATASFSNTGNYVRLAAPGVSILSTWKGSGYTSASGTSMASPYVSAVAAILASAEPSATPAQLTAALTTTAADKGVPGRDPEYGYGIVDPAAALCTFGLCGGSPTTSPTPTPSPTTSPTPTTSPAPGTKASVTLTLKALPTRLRYGSTFTVSGTITAAGHPLGGAPVQACFRRVDRTTCGSAYSSAAGLVTWSFTAYGSGTVTARYAGSDSTTAATSRPQPVRVQSIVTATRPAKRTLRLTVQPVRGQTVVLQKLRGTSWKALRQQTLPSLAASSRGVLSVAGLSAGTYRFRVVARSGLLAETLTNRVALA
jgi:serine protease